jgi:hypothetical protein
MVFSGLVTACRLAGWPTRRSSSVKATIDGVVRAPFGVFDDPRLAAIHDGDAGVGRAEVDPNHFGHEPQGGRLNLTLRVVT